MKINLNGLTRIGARAVMKVKKVSPELLLAGGIACGIGAIVLGCIASRKVDKTIEESRNKIDDIQKNIEAASTKEAKKDLKKVAFKAYVDMGWELAKLYAPTIGLTMASTGLILASHGILNKRYVGTVAAYQTLGEAFKDYRRRVAETLGEEAEKVLNAGGKVEKNISVANENGEVEQIKGSNIVIQKHKESPYEFDFNRFTAKGVWEPSADYIDMRLRNTQNYFNELFNARGHVFLNEILDELGLARTPAGAVCGWVKGAGDDYIDFGYWDSFKRDYDQDSDLCVKNVHLNFNCDGPIWDLI